MMATKVARKRLSAGGSEYALTVREAAFVEAYLSNNMNGTQAAIKAGYSPVNAKRRAVTMLAKPTVQKVLRDRQDQLAKKHRMTTDSVMSELSKIVHSDLRKLFDANGALLPIHDWPDDMAGAVASIEVEELFEGSGENRRQIGFTKKVKCWDKNSAIEKAMKHLGLFAEDNRQKLGALAELPRDVLQAMVAHLQQHVGGGQVVDGQARRV